MFTVGHSLFSFLSLSVFSNLSQVEDFSFTRILDMNRQIMSWSPALHLLLRRTSVRRILS